MAVSIRELKRRYKTGLALGTVLPTHDRGIPLPLSTGLPLADAALTDKLVATTTMNEPEHLRRAWFLVREASEPEHAAVHGHRRALLNDYKLLLALHAWERGDEEGCRSYLGALPWGWRLRFPTAVIKPAAAIFTGWRRTLSFRLADGDLRFPALRTLFRETLAAAPGVALLKYRNTVKESAALLKFRFEGERERAIHDLCFKRGADGCDIDSLEPIGTYLRARAALANTGSIEKFLAALEGHHPIPITSYMGLLGGRGVSLTDYGHTHCEELRAYAVRCATAVESLLRLVEWGPWLDEAHAEALAAKVRSGILDRGLPIPFFKVTKVFMKAPTRVRKLLLDPLYRPLLQHFGRRVGGLLDPGGTTSHNDPRVTFFQPANIVHVMSFLLYATVASATPARLVLLRKDGVDEVSDLDLDAVVSHLSDSSEELERWLLSEFGGLTSRASHTYDFAATARLLRTLDPRGPLVLDLPFVDNMDILGALLPFERVFNLSNAFGAPGEVCIATEYYRSFFVGGYRWSYSVWGRYSDAAAQSFAEFLERLQHFESIAATAPSPALLAGGAP